MYVYMNRCKAMNQLLTGLILLAFTAISQHSLYHLILFLLSLYLNVQFAFRRPIRTSKAIIISLTAYLVLHTAVLIIAQIDYIREHLHVYVTRALGLYYPFCSADVQEGCGKQPWNVVIGSVTEVVLAVLLQWKRNSLSTAEFASGTGTESVDPLRQMYLLTPFSIILWALLFPSWLNFLWILASWFLFSLIGERRHRLTTAPLILIYASILLLIQYVSGLTSFHSITLQKLGFHSGVGAAAFYPLLIKMLLCVPFYMMRYLDGKELEMPVENFDVPEVQVRRLSLTMVSLESANRLEWITPFICLFSCILYVCLYYMYTLLYADWPILSPNQWLSPAVLTLASALWLPFGFIYILIFVHMKRLDSSMDTVWRPTSVLARTIAANYDTLIAISLCAFAGYDLSIAGIVLLMVSLVIFITTGRKCTLACSAVALLLSFVWLMSFVAYTFRLRNLAYPQDCRSDYRIVLDHNTAQWIGVSPNQAWPIVILLLIISLRTAFPSDRSEWLIEVQRSDAEEDVASLLKFLLKYWMHKFGVEVCSILGAVLACCHRDIFGLYFLIMVSFLRICTRRRQKLFWTCYTNLTLIVLVLEYLSALGLPHQFSHCHHYFWSKWSVEVKKYFVLPFTMSSCPTLIADYILLLLILVQKEIFNREKDHPGGDNTPLSETDFNQPIPPMYSDFISTKGNLLAYIHTAIFLYSHWASMIVILLCSIDGGTILNFGYMAAVFLFLWKETALYACHSFKSFLGYWNCLIYYNIFLMIFKILYLDASCEFGISIPCWLERALGLRCSSSECFAPNQSTSLVYDVICFAVLTYQMRIFNSWYFQYVIMDYRADRILGSRGAELLLEIRDREARKNQRLLHSNVKWLELMVEEEDRQAPTSVGLAPRSHEEIKRSGYYHQVSERYFPKLLQDVDVDFDQKRRFSVLSRASEVSMAEVADNATMVEKTVEVLDSIRVTAMHLLQLLNNPEWLFQISKGHAYVAHVLDNDKKRIKTILKDRLRTAVTDEELHALRGELILGEDFQSIASSEVLWNEALNEYRAIHPAFKFLYCVSHAVMAQSELVCFLLMLIVHLSKSSLITLPLPLMVFFWGALAIPRPPRAFWLITASYIQLIIVFRLLFRNELIPVLSTRNVNSNNDPFSYQRLFAMDPSVDGSYWDVALLFMVFLHRYKLLRLGMWNDEFQLHERRLSLQEEVQEEDEEVECKPARGCSAGCEAFCKSLLRKKTASTMDWYPWMVGCDALCLILISFFYSMMGQGGSGNVLLDVQSSRLPRWFAYTLLSVFVIMIIDRWLYLSKQVKFRFLYYVCLVVLLHVVIFFFVPSITGRMVTYNGVAISLYLIKSAYLLMSAWHMRNGYPSVINRDILARNYGIFRLAILKIYLNVPFLFELRTAMDWTFTATALTMADFIRMENYCNEIVAQHCWIQFDHWIDDYFPTRRGRTTPTSGKFFKGVSSVIALIITILAPILLFAFLNSFGTRAPPKRLQVTASIEGYPALYSTETVFNDQSMPHLSQNSMQTLINELTNLEESDVKRSALSFITDYTYKDVFLVDLAPDSLRNWEISEPGKRQLLKELQTSTSTRFIFEMSLLRPVGSTQRSHNFILSTQLTPMQAKIFLNLIDGNITTANMSFPIAQFLLAPPNGYLTPAAAINLALKRWFSLSTWEYPGKYWSVTWKQKLVIFVDRVVPSWMSIVVGSGGMAAMYVAVILVAGRFLREAVRTPIHNAMVENIPNCENLLRLFHDIYVVREKRQFYLESRLYGKLVFLVRSPETLIRWSRYRVKVKDD